MNVNENYLQVLSLRFIQLLSVLNVKSILNYLNQKTLKNLNCNFIFILNFFYHMIIFIFHLRSFYVFSMWKIFMKYIIYISMYNKFLMKKIEYPTIIIFFSIIIYIYIYTYIIIKIYKIYNSSYFTNYFMTSSIVLLKKITSKMCS